MPGSSASRAVVSAGPAPGSRLSRPAAAAVASARSVRCRLVVRPSPDRSAPASSAGLGNSAVSPAGLPGGAGGPCCAASRPANVRAAATETCWPSTARTASSNPSKLPGTRSPGRARTSGASSSSAASAASMAAGSASASSSLRLPAASWLIQPGWLSPARSSTCPWPGRGISSMTAAPPGVRTVLV